MGRDAAYYLAAAMKTFLGKKEAANSALNMDWCGVVRSWVSPRRLQAGRFEPLVHLRAGFGLTNPAHGGIAHRPMRKQLGFLAKSPSFFEKAVFK
jgi:hypothetical protein